MRCSLNAEQLFHPARLERRSRLLALEDRDLGEQLLDNLGLPALFFQQTLDLRQEHLNQRRTFGLTMHRQWIRISHTRLMRHSGV